MKNMFPKGKEEQIDNTMEQLLGSRKSNARPEDENENSPQAARPQAQYQGNPAQNPAYVEEVDKIKSQYSTKGYNSFLWNLFLGATLVAGGIVSATVFGHRWSAIVNILGQYDKKKNELADFVAYEDLLSKGYKPKDISPAALFPKDKEGNFLPIESALEYKRNLEVEIAELESRRWVQEAVSDRVKYTNLTALSIVAAGIGIVGSIVTHSVLRHRFSKTMDSEIKNVNVKYGVP